MEFETRPEAGGEVEPPIESQFTGEIEPNDSSAWEQVAEGRYMPRRIKGSCKGRSLG